MGYRHCLQGREIKYILIKKQPRFLKNTYFFALFFIYCSAFLFCIINAEYMHITQTRHLL